MTSHNFILNDDELTLYEGKERGFADYTGRGFSVPSSYSRGLL